MISTGLTQQLGLFGDTHDIFQSAKERYGIWPLTVWNVNHADKSYKQLKERIGDDGAQRRDCFTAKIENTKSVYGGKVTESIFNPQIALWILNCFAPENGLCFDPFGGGGTRAILAAKHGLKYVGIELRGEEVAATLGRCKRNGVLDMVTIIQGDARNSIDLIDKGSADFLLTCPPYYDLERYNGGAADLSMLPTYERFLEALSIVIEQCYSILRPGALAAWVVGLHRDKRGGLLAMNHDIARLHKESGFVLREEIVLNHINQGAIQRIGNFEKGNKYLVRTHEYALIFQRPGG